jgi:hypothetical protein
VCSMRLRLKSAQAATRAARTVLSTMGYVNHWLIRHQRLSGRVPTRGSARLKGIPAASRYGPRFILTAWRLR